MKINLEIIDSSYLFDEKQIGDLNTKELVPKMVFRRRLTRASKLIIELLNKIDFKNERILYGSAYGELLISSKILNSILNKEGISPTDFQNSVYNTGVSYSSILLNNQNEIMTISSGEETSLKTLKAAAIKSLDGDELVLICTETLDIENIEEINKCIKYLESAVILKVKCTNEKATINFDDLSSKGDLPKSIEHMFYLSQKFDKDKKNIIEIEI